MLAPEARKSAAAALCALILVCAPLAAQAQDEAARRILNRPAAGRDASLYVDAATVADALAAGEDLALIDVRSEGEWRGTRLPGSLNMPAHELKARSGLRGRIVVLVDQGWNDRRLERVCRDARERGWAFVAILDGGVAGWLAARRAVEGTGEGRDGLREMAAAEYLSVRADTDRVGVEDEARPSSPVTLHVRDGQAGLDRQLRDMAAMQRSTIMTIEGAGVGAGRTIMPKVCATCP